jgi:hypothetical protein
VAKVPPPRGGRKGAPPAPAGAGDNLARPAGAVLKPLNFRVSPEFHREFKTFAATEGRSMVDVLHEAFDLIRAKHR